MKKVIILIGILALTTLTAGCICPQPQTKPRPEQLGVKPGEIFREVGRGAVPPDAVNEAQGNLLAQRAAKLDACRNLLEAVKGVQITSKTKVEDFITTEDKIQSAVEGIIQGVVVDRTEKMSDGSWEVEVYLTYEQLKEIMEKI